MKITLLILTVLTGYSFNPNFYSDIESDTPAKTLEIGEQVWMTENLNVSTFRNGDTIQQSRTAEEWKNANENKIASWCYYNNDSTNGDKYGKLYNWYAVTDSRGLSPEGWHIPTNSEWSILIDSIEPQPILDTANHDYMGIDNFGVNCAPKMKSKEGWIWEMNGNNESGFNGLPGGFRSQNGEFFSIGGVCNWWSSDEGNIYNGICRQLTIESDNLVHIENNKGDGHFVRCVKD
ncbi:MAG: hypothetical protein ACJAV5_002298 [Vicingaceae bacterium]|jgi:uncharacterized protein (TIGR02145 family)